MTRFTIDLDERPLNSYEQLKLSGQLESLEDSNQKKEVSKFDQFKGKSTTYEFRKYTSALDECKITEEQKVQAEQVAREIENKEGLAEDQEEGEEQERHGEEMKFSSLSLFDGMDREAMQRRYEESLAKVELIEVDANGLVVRRPKLAPESQKIDQLAEHEASIDDKNDGESAKDLQIEHINSIS